MTAEQAAIEDEQRQLDGMFARRDELLALAERELQHLADERPDSGRDHIEAQARARHLRRRRVELDRADRGLCFGRLEHRDGEPLHIGRLGLPSHDAEADPLLIDWRAPVARPFYTATAARPLGLRARRHIRTDGREVLGVDDESFDRDGTASGAELVGEAALIAALDARRTGRMLDVVATLQSEQDEIIRSPQAGCVVVQGGPGTGKTAVALHRAAYLLFSSERLVERGVLVVGPSAAFLDYIGQVLPSLGETQVVTTTMDRLLPGVTATRGDDAATAAVKGRAVWADILHRVVTDRWPTPTALEFPHGGDRLTLTRGQVDEALRSARAGGRSYTETGVVVRRRLVDRLARTVVERGEQLLAATEVGFEHLLAAVDRSLAGDDRISPRGSAQGTDVDGVATADEIDDLRDSLGEDVDVAAVLDRFWPALDVPALLADLLDDEEDLARVAPELTGAELSAVRHTGSTGWSSADVPLLDELAELVGWPGATPVQAPADASDGGATSGPKDQPTGGSGEARQAEGEADRVLAEVALNDRRWAYGHVIVDEAQELSAMQWRMLVRRCPPGSFTVVGDVNQTESPGGTPSWAAVLDPVFGDRWRQSELTISYRTPQEVMERTVPVLAAAGSAVDPPRAVRSNGVEPWRREVAETELAATVGTALRDLRDRYAGGRVAVIAPRPRHDVLRPVTERGGAQLLTPSGSKGLEFDAVLVVDPHAITARPRGWNALYVAMTRCTQELGVVALAPGPAELAWPRPTGDDGTGAGSGPTGA